MMLAITNAVNFTDGLDGLLSGISAIAFGAFAIVAMQATSMPAAVCAAAMIELCLVFLYTMRIRPKCLWETQAH